MINFKHLTKGELAAYSLGTLETGESHEIGRHLLTCAKCRKLMPMPSIKRFWTAIMLDSEIKDTSAKSEADAKLVAIFSPFLSFLKLQSGFLWRGAALVLLLSLSFSLWLSVSDSSREVVQSYEFRNSVSDARQNFPIPLQNSATNKSLSANSSNSIVVPTQKTPRKDSAKTNLMTSAEKNLNSTFDLKNSKNKNISTTRGVLPKCVKGQVFETETYSGNQTIILRWKKIPNAAKYHLYVSDENEILIDEFETSKETSYTVKRPLDFSKIYKWRIVVTLENGETVVGESQEITVRDYSNKRANPGKVRNSVVRCSDN